jgi:hypothetical protein
MDQEPPFFADQPVDRTPYGAFAWVITLALLLTIGIGYGIWKSGSWVKGQRFLQSSNRPGSTDAFLENAQREGSNALDQARNAAEQAAAKAAQDAANRAAQELLEEGKSTLKGVVENPPTPSSGSSFQDYLQ